jgi:hypothetical protein
LEFAKPEETRKKKIAQCWEMLGYKSDLHRQIPRFALGEGCHHEVAPNRNRQRGQAAQV